MLIKYFLFKSFISHVVPPGVPCVTEGHALESCSLVDDREKCITDLHG